MWAVAPIKAQYGYIYNFFFHFLLLCALFALDSSAILFSSAGYVSICALLLLDHDNDFCWQ